MKFFYFFCLLAFCSNTISSQIVVVSGQCIPGPITLNPAGTVDGKPAYEGTGTVLGFPGIQVSIFWMPAPDNVWVLAFDGQPYLQNTCNTSLPPATNNTGCAWTTVAGQTCTGATPLSITGTGALPVIITSLNARVVNKQVLINWKTATEINNKGFEVERTTDGIHWVVTGFVNGAGNSSIEKSYQFIDDQPLPGKSFYRLRQVDLDGRFMYSTIVSANVLKQGLYSISGNGGANIYQLNIEPVNAKVELVILDAGGKRLMTKITGPGIQTINISNYPAGIYLLQVKNGTDLFTEKLIKY